MIVRLVFSLLGADRTGLVERLSRAVTDHGGNLEDARMSVLGGEFAVMVLVAVDSERRAALEKAVREAADNLQMMLLVKETSMGTPAKVPQTFTVAVHGADHEGIVHPIVNWLASQGMSIVNLDSRVSPAPHTGTHLFSMTLHVEAPSALSMADIHVHLQKIGDRLNVDVDVEPGHASKALSSQGR